MRRHARGARSARPSARACAGPGRRGSPETENVSSSKPASGTSRVSTRSGDPANVTWTSRAASASATASDGSTWPAVPPAAIRHLSGCFSTLSRDVKEDARRGERDNEARAPVRDERERDSRQRSETEHRSEIDQRLAANERRQAGREPLAERIAAAQGDPQPRVGERDIGRERERRTKQAELLADRRENHVRVRLGQIVGLLDSLSEAGAQPATRP